MAFPGGLQLGGGVTAANAAEYLGAGASHVIVTSWVFREGRLDRERLAELVRGPQSSHGRCFFSAWVYHGAGASHVIIMSWVFC